MTAGVVAQAVRTIAKAARVSVLIGPLKSGSILVVRPRGQDIKGQRESVCVMSRSNGALSFMGLTFEPTGSRLRILIHVRCFPRVRVGRGVRTLRRHEAKKTNDTRRPS